GRQTAAQHRYGGLPDRRAGGRGAGGSERRIRAAAARVQLGSAPGQLHVQTGAVVVSRGSSIIGNQPPAVGPQPDRTGVAGGAGLEKNEINPNTEPGVRADPVAARGAGTRRG